MKLNGARCLVDPAERHAVLLIGSRVRARQTEGEKAEACKNIPDSPPPSIYPFEGLLFGKKTVNIIVTPYECPCRSPCNIGRIQIHNTGIGAGADIL